MTRTRGGLKAVTVAVLLAVALLTTGCGFVPSAYRVDLYRTSWQVTEVDGSPTEMPVQLAFNPGGRDGTVALETPCGMVTMSVDLDSDGDGIGFFDPTASATDCSEADRAVADAVLASLQTVEDWSVDNDNRVFLKGDRQIVLER